MRKRIITRDSQSSVRTDEEYMDLQHLAQVEITSEDPAFPFESALTEVKGKGWKAGNPGKQIIRILFDEPQNIKRIHLQFDEETRARTHEFVIFWSSADEASYREVVRQQFTFSPPATTSETEDYVVSLNDVKILELQIVPDITNGNAIASLTNLQIS
jgi:hypothetical protein